MKKFLAATAVLLSLFPVTTLAYTQTQLPKSQNCTSPKPPIHRRRSRRLLWNDVLSWRTAHRPAASGILAYEDPATGLTLRYPAAWEVRPGIFGTVVSFLSPREEGDVVRENINVVEQTLPSPAFTLAAYSEGTIRSLQTTDRGLRLLASEGKIVAGLAAHAITYEEESTLGRVTFRQVWMIKDGHAYLFTLLATPETFEEHAKVLETMLASMKIPG